MPRIYVRRDPRERFDEKWRRDPASGCWLWTAGTSNGYGSFSMSTEEGSLRASVAAWLLYRGPVPPGLSVLHRCGVKLCVNPDHLYLGTHVDNQRDAERLSEWLPGVNVLRGDRHPTRKLTDEQVGRIREDPRAARIVAEEYDITETYVRMLRRGSARTLEAA